MDATGLFNTLRPGLAPGTVLRRDEPLAKKTTLRVGGPADLYVEPADETELAWVVKTCAQAAAPCLVLGRGSNLLIQDGGIRGVVISLAHPNFSRVEVVDGRFRCGAGARLKTVAVEARRLGVAGFEFLEGIPGSVGGALRMNAGAMGDWIFAVVETVRYMDQSGVVVEAAGSSLNPEYRSCAFLRQHIALAAVLRGRTEPPEAIARRMNDFSQKRWKTQPAAPSAGCIFKNPADIPAGKLIDELGLKGSRVGGALVSEVHGNFIVNEGTATAGDVLRLIEMIREKARHDRGIELETEVQIVGVAA